MGKAVVTLSSEFGYRWRMGGTSQFKSQAILWQQLFLSSRQKTAPILKFLPLLFSILIPQIAQAAPEPLAPTEIPGKITLQKFELIGNRVIPQAEINQILNPYLNRPISFSELLEVQKEVTQLYVDRGYLTSGAHIPPQTIQNNTIRIEIIEGSISEIKIRGLQRLNQGYIHNRLTRATQAPLHREKLLNSLKLLQLDPLIANISAELSDGINPGENFLEIEVEEADTFATILAVDNYRSLNVGSFSRQVSLQESNLLGYGDRLAGRYVQTDGSDSWENLSYEIPLAADQSSLSFSYSSSQSRIIREPFQDLDLASDNRFFETVYRQPLHRTPNQEFALGLSFSHQNSQLSLQEVGFPDLARGSDLDGRTRISALRFFQEYSGRNERSVVAFRSQISLGINAFDATDNEDGRPDSNFVLWRGQGQYLQKIAPQSNLLLRTDLQLADRGLVTVEQFSTGGALSVRGYSQDRIISDNGIFASAELRNTLWQKPNYSLVLSPFVDFGYVWNSDELDLEFNTLASTGLGLSLDLQNKFIAQLDWGLPILNTSSGGDSLQENGVYFSLQVKPF